MLLSRTRGISALTSFENTSKIFWVIPYNSYRCSWLFIVNVCNDGRYHLSRDSWKNSLIWIVNHFISYVRLIFFQSILILAIFKTSNIWCCSRCDWFEKIDLSCIFRELLRHVFLLIDWIFFYYAVVVFIFSVIVLYFSQIYSFFLHKRSIDLIYSVFFLSTTFVFQKCR
jgi:hypothetical protein